MLPKLGSASVLLIATDEAGYGPRLGPLVIVGTAWRIRDINDASAMSIGAWFEALREPVVVDDLQIVVNDSKQIFSPSRPDGYRKLHAAVCLGARCMGLQADNASALVDAVAPDDLFDLLETPWLRRLEDQPLLAAELTENAYQHWKALRTELVGARARLVTARRFNRYCDSGLNKADLLSETTLQLVRQLFLAHVCGDEPVWVFCDRHGGRRYYGGVLQHVFPDSHLRIDTESPRTSSYWLQIGSREMRVEFAVQGDRFPPVAMSSIYAKFLREYLMRSLNDYFLVRHRGRETFRSTAGYPVDAERFLEQILPTRQRERILDSDLIRCR